MRYVVIKVVALGLAISLSACSGGGGGGTPVDPGPDSADAMRPPADTDSRYSRDYSRDNPSAEDLLDHWNDSQTLQAAMGLSAVSRTNVTERKNILKALIDGAGASSDNDGARFRNARAGDVEIIGEKNGITYGQWKGGPAGTFNIEFDWHFAEHVDANVRVIMERVGKIWSYRLQDDIGTHTVEKGSYVRRNYGHWVLDRTLTTNGLIISMLSAPVPDGECYGCWEFGTAPDGSWTGWNVSEDDYEPWWGFLQLRPDLLREGGPWVGSRDLVRVVAHEIGHALGAISGQSEIEDWAFPTPSYDRHVDAELGTFNGPATVAANGGDPVYFQRLGPNQRGRHHTFDLSHIRGCMAVTGICDESPRTQPALPTEIDFAVLSDIGWELLDADTAAQPEVYGWGAWGTYSAWGVGVGRTIEFDHLTRSEDRLFAAADAFGIAPATSLTDNSALSGTATWSGSLLGADLGQPMLPPVFGDAELQVNLSSLAGVARFGHLTTYVENQPAPFRAPSLEYTIDVTGNSFSDADDHISGGFFGPAHEEMAGILDDRSPDVNLLAGFGGTR